MITIYDIRGRKVKTLINENQNAGYRITQWNATNDFGQPISAGMYIYAIQAGDFRTVKKDDSIEVTGLYNQMIKRKPHTGLSLY